MTGAGNNCNVTMNPKTCTLTLILGLVCFGAPGLSGETTPSTGSGQAKPNIIFAMADDMGWAQTGYYGHR